MASDPKWRRRKDARPSDIVAAALTVFGEKGFAGARIEEIARRAGRLQGHGLSLFRDQEDIFRAVVHDAITPNIEAMKRAILALDLPFATPVADAPAALRARSSPRCRSARW